MTKRTWKAVASLVIGGVGIAADSPKIEQAVWTRASTPPVAKPVDVVPASASAAVKPQPMPAPAPLPAIPQSNYPLPPKSDSDEAVLPKFRPVVQPAPGVPTVSLPPITMPPVAGSTTTSEKIPLQPPIPPAVVEPVKPLVLPEPNVEKPMSPGILPATRESGSGPIPAVPPPVLPGIPEIAPPAQPAKSADPVKPIPPATDFNLRPVPGGNSVKTADMPAPTVPVPPRVNGYSRPAAGPIPPTEKDVFAIPEPALAAPLTIAKPETPAIPATLSKPPQIPEFPLVPTKPVPSIATPELPPVPMILPGVPTAIERPTKPDFNTIPPLGADPMIFRQTTLAAAIGGALAMMPVKPVLAADPPPKTTEEKLADAQKEIKRLGELLDGRKESDGSPSQYDVGAVKELKKLKDDVFALKTRVQDLETELDKLKKSSTSQKPSQPDPMANKGVVRIENDYSVEITIVVNSMTYRVPANTKLDVTVPVGDFTYMLLNSATSLAPVKSPIKEKEIVRLRIK